jgi:hypothetical protein
VINKEDFTIAYASTLIKPSEQEVNFVKERLLELTSVVPDQVFEHHGFIECHCIDEGQDYYENYVLYCWEVDVPAEIALNADAERRISILQCGNCGKWALCD